MFKYVALLRGINVGGKSMLKMELLRQTLADAGFENIKTYINSGNVVFEAAKMSEAKLAEKIAKALEKAAGRPIPVMVREHKHLTQILETDPFANEYESHKQMHVLFLNGPMDGEKKKLLLAEQTDREKFAVIGSEIYALLLDGVADSLLGKGFIDKILKIQTTGRNWRTIQKIAEM